MSSKITVKCKNCGKEFDKYPSQHKQKYCSKKCREEKRNGSLKSKEYVCRICSKVFRQFDSHVRKHNCCSPECSKKWRKIETNLKHFHHCDYCGKPFVRNTTGKHYKFCSYDCSKKHMTMENSFFYKNGTTINVHGYRMILIGPKKYKGEHRIIMENHIGRELKDDEVVHHKNRNKLDNRVENLELMLKKDHDAMHLEEIRSERKKNKGD